MCDHGLARASMDDYGVPYGGRVDKNFNLAKTEIEDYHKKKFRVRDILKKWSVYKDWLKKKN